MKFRSKKIKINLQLLPTSGQQLEFFNMLASAWMRSVGTRDFAILDIAYRLSWAATDFLYKYEQTRIKDLAMDAINEVQPELPEKKETVSDVCGKCDQRHRCRHLKHDTMTREYFCPIIRKFQADRTWKIYQDHLQNRDEKPMDYTRDDRKAIAEGWKIPLS